jgi:hypothetical protein
VQRAYDLAGESPANKKEKRTYVVASFGPSAGNGRRLSVNSESSRPEGASLK